MERPGQFAHSRYIGDKRTLVVYDIDHLGAQAESLVSELLESKRFLSFGPDHLAEARNRGYRLYQGPGAGARSGSDETNDTSTGA